MTQLESDNGHFTVPASANNPSSLQHKEFVSPGSSSSTDHDTEKATTVPISHAKESAYASLGWLDRLLALWILLAIIIGIVIGNFAPGAEAALQRGKFVQVSVPVAVGLLVMMYPILCKVKFESLHRVFRTREVWRQLLFSVVMNWVVAPFLMVGRSFFLKFVSSTAPSLHRSFLLRVMELKLVSRVRVRAGWPQSYSCDAS